MTIRTRIPALFGAAALAFSLGACQDQTPLSNSAETPAVPQPQQVSNQATFGNLIAALNNITVQIDRLNALNNLTIGDVTLVNIQDLLNGNNVRAFNNALNRNNVEIVTLRNVLNNNEIIKNALNNFNILNNLNVVVGQLVAINVLSGGVTVFFDPTITVP